MSNCIKPMTGQVVFASASAHCLKDTMLLESLISRLDVYLYLSGGAERETFYWRADARLDTRQGKVSACNP